MIKTKVVKLVNTVDLESIFLRVRVPPLVSQKDLLAYQIFYK